MKLVKMVNFFILSNYLHVIFDTTHAYYVFIFTEKVLICIRFYHTDFEAHMMVQRHFAEQLRPGFSGSDTQLNRLAAEGLDVQDDTGGTATPTVCLTPLDSI